VIGRYAVLAGRIRQDVADLDRVVERVERAVKALGQQAEEHDLFLDSAALNLHDFYTGLERVFTLVASGIDQSVPSGTDWHRELLRQMTVAVAGIRPAVISAELAGDVDEFLRFRHVVRHIYSFDLDAERVQRLTIRLRPTFEAVQAALVDFATFLDGVAHDA
jgi:hypothetical protein